MELIGKEVFITAPSQRIGRDIAERFVSEGASVAATGINIELLKWLKGAKTYKMEVTNK